jgi:hypothetical protein
MIWTEDMDAVLIAGWNEGLSSFQIAAVVGGISASAVRGRRIDLSLPPRGVATLVFAGRFKSAYQPPASKAVPVCVNLGPLSEPRPFIDREAGQCAFVVSDGRDEVMACCAPIPAGARRPYCLFHQALTAHAA